jgi:hypothetical protein
MDIDALSKNITNLTHEFYGQGNVSICSLLEGTGYCQSNHQITEDDIIKALRENPSLAIDWLKWSSNKRVDSGWYFKQDDKERYTVGYHSGNINQSSTYSSMLNACAVFILKEVESIRVQ